MGTNEHYFDAVVVGSGTSAYYAVDGLRKAGRHVAIVDRRPYGGTCALRGCQPKKYLVSNAEAVAMARQLLGRGIATAPTSDWQALQALKNDFLEGKPESAVKSWQRAGVATFHGPAVMAGEDVVEVGEDRLKAQHIVLATGAAARHLEIPGAEHLHDSEYFLDLPELPERIVFIGGGYISFEFAHVAVRAGARRVSILQRSAHPLKSFDQDVVQCVVDASRAIGIDVVLNESPTSVEPQADGLVVTGATGAAYRADLVMEAVGRVPQLDVLEGGRGNVESSPHGIVVNEFLQSVSNPRVYAIGDCAATPYMLAPVADEEGKAAAENILGDNVRSMDYSVVPSVVFTIPSLGSVGLTEQQAREQHRDFRVNRGKTIAWPSAKRIGEEHGQYKVLIDNETDRLIGAHLARHDAAEAINVLALAMKHKIKAAELAGFMWAYPTITSDLKYMVK